jgi:UPF0176 protein
MTYKILKFYHFKQIERPENILENLRTFTHDLDIRGRIIVAKEGVNGTISAPVEDCEKYKRFVLNELGLESLDFKDDLSNGHVFHKLSIKVKNEIIKMGVPSEPVKETGTHISPQKWKNLIKDPRNIIMDFRSNHEHKLGKFKNAVTFNMEHMYEFPHIFNTHPLFTTPGIKSKKILTYCTGGIKCEKATNFLLRNGFEDVNQLEGGIIRYSKDQLGEDFDGKCYVFDDRIAIQVNSINPKVISNCYICEMSCSAMVNCMNTRCSRHTTICKKCYNKYDSCCSEKCKTSIFKRSEYIDYFGKGGV